MICVAPFGLIFYFTKLIVRFYIRGSFFSSEIYQNGKVWLEVANSVIPLTAFLMARRLPALKTMRIIGKNFALLANCRFCRIICRTNTFQFLVVVSYITQTLKNSMCITEIMSRSPICKKSRNYSACRKKARALSGTCTTVILVTSSGKRCENTRNDYRGKLE